MRLKSTFVQLKCLFDKDQLKKEVMNLPDEAWNAHPQGFKGNYAVSLVAKDGDSKDDSTYGSMMATQWLDESPYIKSVFASLQIPVGRSRLMRIRGHSKVPSHTDLDYYWQRRMRIHIPIVTNKGVRFECGDDSVHMQEGETWIFDTTQLHRVINPEGQERIHLVIDTVGSKYLFSLFTTNYHKTKSKTIQDLTQLNEKNSNLKLCFESHNRPLVMSPHEQREIFAELIEMFLSEHDRKAIEAVVLLFQPIMHDWNANWAIYGDKFTGIEEYKVLQKKLAIAAENHANNILFRGSSIGLWLKHWIVEPSLDLDGLYQKNTEQELPSIFSGFSDSLSPNIDNTIKSFDSQYTESFPGLIAHLGGTLVATTYASNRVVLLRAQGEELNTHFKEYTGAMGLAYNGEQIALGAENSIWMFRSQPDLGVQFTPNCDAVYVPTRRHMTGDIRVHELGWSSENELWIVNTRFSCLATLDDNHSFVPRWHPHFVNKLSVEDACHLNGMAMRDGEPAWVSALGVSAKAGGWRENKRDGGVVIDVSSGEIATSGLCMPHSPRWHGDKLWVLDSGRGELCQVDPKSGEWQVVTRLPGFARGLMMIDRYAFVGCSRVREAAFFGGLPVLGREKPPECGIWGIDLVTGQIAGWINFGEGIDEIFDLQWLPQHYWPEILEPDEETSRNGFALPPEKFSRFQ